jgi:hypothetical protein
MADHPRNVTQYYRSLLADYSRIVSSDRHVLSLAWQFPYYLCYRLHLNGRRALIGALIGGLRKRVPLGGARARAAGRPSRA